MTSRGYTRTLGQQTRSLGQLRRTLGQLTRTLGLLIRTLEQQTQTLGQLTRTLGLLKRTIERQKQISCRKKHDLPSTNKQQKIILKHGSFEEKITYLAGTRTWYQLDSSQWSCAVLTTDRDCRIVFFTLA